MSSSTDHTPTQAQKNVATSEGRHLGFVTSFLPSLHSAGCFGETNKMRESELGSTEWEHMRCLNMRRQRFSQVPCLLCCCHCPLTLLQWDLGVSISKANADIL